MQILPALNSGGVERGVIDISKAVSAAGFNSIVLSSGGKMMAHLNNSKVIHLQLPLNSKNPWVIYQNSKKIAKIIKDYQVDLVHIRSRAPAWSAFLACQKTGCKIISTIHGYYSTNLFSKKPSFLKLKYNSVMLKPNFIIAVSDFIKNYITQNYSKIEPLEQKEIRVIHRGVDLEHFCNSKVGQSKIIQLIKKWDLPDDKQIIMLPGRISSWKGHQFLVSALAKVQNQNFLCIMVGSVDGHKNFVTKLEQEIIENNLQGKIKIVGENKDMPAAYLISDIVISSSIKAEAFGRIAIEAGAMGRVVIATKVGGSLETIIDGKTGFLVPVNDIDFLAKTIDKVLQMNQEKKAEIGKNAIAHISQNFSNQKMTDATIDFYQKIISSKNDLFNSN